MGNRGKDKKALREGSFLEAIDITQERKGKFTEEIKIRSGS